MLNLLLYLYKRKCNIFFTMNVIYRSEEHFLIKSLPEEYESALLSRELFIYKIKDKQSYNLGASSFLPFNFVRNSHKREIFLGDEFMSEFVPGTNS